jgi:hydrogenase expression/formation protein HypC
MCLAVPVEVVEVTGDSARVRSLGEVKTVDSSLISGLKRGDYVLVHGGLAIQKLDADDARKTLELLNQMIEESV